MIKTKQELLNHFSDINAMYNNPFMYQTLSNMIDELLEQQPSEDCISRQAVETFKEELIDKLAYTGYTEEYKNEIIDIINQMPSVYPKRPKGKWIAEKKTIWHEYYDDAYEEEITVWRCSNCNYDMGTINPDDYKRCPNCGAEMNGDGEE